MYLSELTISIYHNHIMHLHHKASEWGGARGDIKEGTCNRNSPPMFRERGGCFAANHGWWRA